MKKPRYVHFAVSFVLPSGATVADARAYVQDSVATWAGSLKPPGVDEEDIEGDPMFGLNRNSVTVKQIR